MKKINRGYETMAKPEATPKQEISVNALIIWLANSLLGEPRYRIKFIYRNQLNQELFSYTRTVSLKDRWYIDQHREIKCAFGPVWDIPNTRPYLQNGTLSVEPVCCLGRWKDR